VAELHCVSTLLLTLATGACAYGQRMQQDPLATLPALLAPASELSTCQPMPDTLSVELTATGPFMLCDSPSFVTLRAKDGHTVWFTRNWRPGPRPRALATRDSLVQRIAARYGQPLMCVDERRVWNLKGYFMQLRVEPTTDVVRADASWRVELDGQVGESPGCGRRAA